MTNNEKIAVWAGKCVHKWDASFYGPEHTQWVCKKCKAKTQTYTPEEMFISLPDSCTDYENSDAAAITLMPVLVEKEHDVRIQSFITDPEQERWQVSIWRIEPHEEYCIVDLFAPTISSAITQAVLRLIESEAQDGQL